MTEESINKAIRDAINKCLDIEGFAVRGNQNDAPRPHKNYATVVLNSHELDGMTGSHYADGIETTQSSEMFTYSLQFYYKGAYDYALKVARSFSRSDIVAIFSDACIGFVESTSVRDITNFFENGSEERAAFEITIHTIYTDSIEVVPIPCVEIGNKHYNLIES